MKFKVGDEVELTERRYSNPELPIGTVGKIRSIRDTYSRSDQFYLVDFPEHPGVYPPERVLQAHAPDQLREGDRVEYIAGNSLHAAHMVGRFGTVVQVFPSNARIKWDNGGTVIDSWMRENLRKIEQAPPPLSPGDRVEYFDGVPGALRDMIGERGTFEITRGSQAYVRWDNRDAKHFMPSYSVGNIRKINEDEEKQVPDTQLENAIKRAEAAENALKEFKQQVAEVATRYGEEHSMCSVLDQALDELGLERVNAPMQKITVLVETVIYAARNGSYQRGDESFVKECLDYNDATLDSDWDEDDSESSVVSVTVEDDDR